MRTSAKVSMVRILNYKNHLSECHPCTASKSQVPSISFLKSKFNKKQTDHFQYIQLCHQKKKEMKYERCLQHFYVYKYILMLLLLFICFCMSILSAFCEGEENNKNLNVLPVSFFFHLPFRFSSLHAN